MMNMSIFNGMFGRVDNGKCRLSINGDIAVKTSNGYKYYNMKSGRLVNCDSFAFDIGEDFFFVIPTNKVKRGDIILVNGKPKCVKEVKDDSIIVINYEDNTIDTILPERHVLMGKAYFYGKIVSMFGNNLFKKSGDGLNNMMKYMMISEMFKGNQPTIGGNNNGGLSSLLPLMLMGGGMNNMFDGMFDFDTLLDTNDADEDDKEGEDKNN